MIYDLPPAAKSINIKGRLLTLEKPIVMGVLNITSDSFYDGGKYETPGQALDQAINMLDAGASIIDIGAMSSKPGAPISDANLEAQEVVPLVQAILKMRPEAILSIDTLHATVADAALRNGAAIINDISAATFDPKMIEVMAIHQAPVILMHMQGLPENMQENPRYEDVVTAILDFFIERIDVCVQAGIKDIIVDPGFGFGKTLAHNFKLLNQLPAFHLLGKPILAGLSRKSMIWKTLGGNPETALNGTTALNMVALMHAASILRVHDVQEAMEVISLFNSLKETI